MFKNIIFIILTVIGVAVLIHALPVILAILYIGGVLIYSLITGESIWGEHGPFW